MQLLTSFKRVYQKISGLLSFTIGCAGLFVG
jgi:hypothetical protein